MVEDELSASQLSLAYALVDSVEAMAKATRKALDALDEHRHLIDRYMQEELSAKLEKAFVYSEGKENQDE